MHALSGNSTTIYQSTIKIVRTKIKTRWIWPRYLKYRSVASEPLLCSPTQPSNFEILFLPVWLTTHSSFRHVSIPAVPDSHHWNSKHLLIQHNNWEARVPLSYFTIESPINSAVFLSGTGGHSNQFPLHVSQILPGRRCWCFESVQFSECSRTEE